MLGHFKRIHTDDDDKVAKRPFFDLGLNLPNEDADNIARLIAHANKRGGELDEACGPHGFMESYSQINEELRTATCFLSNDGEDADDGYFEHKLSLLKRYGEDILRRYTVACEKNKEHCTDDVETAIVGIYRVAKDLAHECATQTGLCLLDRISKFLLMSDEAHEKLHAAGGVLSAHVGKLLVKDFAVPEH